jgi:hypothetical protein
MIARSMRRNETAQSGRWKLGGEANRRKKMVGRSCKKRIFRQSRREERRNRSVREIASRGE